MKAVWNGAMLAESERTVEVDQGPGARGVEQPSGDVGPVAREDLGEQLAHGRARGHRPLFPLVG